MIRLFLASAMGLCLSTTAKAVDWKTLPLADAYVKICGEDENARKFYFELCKINRQLLDYAANNPKTMGEADFDLTSEIETQVPNLQSDPDTFEFVMDVAVSTSAQ